MRLETVHKVLKRDESYRRAYAEEDLIHRVAERVYALRHKLGWSQQELAEKLDTKQPAIARIERGDANLTLRRIARIAYELDCRPEDLVNRETPLVLHEDWDREEAEEVNETVVSVSTGRVGSSTDVLATDSDGRFMAGGV